MATLIRSPKLGDKRRVVAAKNRQVEPAVEQASVLKSQPSNKVPVASKDEKTGATAATNNAAPDKTNMSDPNALKSNYAQALARAEAAEARLQEIETRLDVCKAETREAGYSAGYSQGEEAGQKAYVAKVKELELLIASLQDQRYSLEAEQEDQLVEIVFAAVSKIIGRTLESREGVKSAVAEVIKQVSLRENLIVHVSPDDFDLLNECKDMLMYDTDAGALELVSDSRVQMGGCILETSGGSLDGRLELQLQALKSALLTVRSSRSVGGTEPAT